MEDFEEFGKQSCRGLNIKEIMDHAWFRHIKWSLAREGKLRPPFIPLVQFDDDTRNFERQPPFDFGDVVPATFAQLRKFENF